MITKNNKYSITIILEVINIYLQKMKGLLVVRIPLKNKAYDKTTDYHDLFLAGTIKIEFLYSGYKYRECSFLSRINCIFARVVFLFACLFFNLL